MSFKVAVEIGRHLRQRSGVSSGEREKKNCIAETTSLSGGGRTTPFNSCSGLQILLIERAHVSEIYWERGSGINRFDGNNGLKCEAILEVGFCRSTLSFKCMLWETFLACGKKNLRGSEALWHSTGDDCDLWHGVCHMKRSAAAQKARRVAQFQKIEPGCKWL